MLADDKMFLTEELTDMDKCEVLYCRLVVNAVHLRIEHSSNTCNRARCVHAQEEQAARK